MNNWDKQIVDGTVAADPAEASTEALSWSEYLARGCEHLRSDNIFAPLIARYDPPGERRAGDLYTDLIDAIVSQQLSVKAAAAIMRRFLDLFPDRKPSPEAVRSVSTDVLRGVGLSRAKVRYLHGIADAVIGGNIKLTAAARLENEAFIAELTRLKGVGRWTAEMLLIFSLGRRDVFSVGDLGLRTAVARLYAVDRDDSEAIVSIADTWRPFRSLACHFLWKSLDNTPQLATERSE